MSKLLEGKTAIVLGVWNKWSIAYAIAQAFVREGATLLLTYQNERAKTNGRGSRERSRRMRHSLPATCSNSPISTASPSRLKATGPQAGCRGALPCVRESRRLEPAVREHFARGIQAGARRERIFARGAGEGSFTADDRRRLDHDADLSGLHARGDQLQRHGSGQSGARSGSEIPGERTWRRARFA